MLYPRGVLQISSDGDDWRIFGGFEISDSVSFLARKIWQVFFLGGLIEVGIYLGIQNKLKIQASAYVSQPRSSANKVQPNLFLKTLFFMFHH